VERVAAAYLCIQKLIDVQQTLIETNPNPLKNIVPLIREKPIKSDISQLLFFESSSFEK
jgi:hypothetical protein